MDWFIICPIRGLIHSIPDDDVGEARVIQYCLQLAKEVKNEGYCLKDIVCIRGERHTMLSPSTEYRLVNRKGF